MRFGRELRAARCSEALEAILRSAWWLRRIELARLLRGGRTDGANKCCREQFVFRSHSRSLALFLARFFVSALLLLPLAQVTPTPRAKKSDSSKEVDVIRSARLEAK